MDGELAPPSWCSLQRPHLAAHRSSAASTGFGSSEERCSLAGRLVKDAERLEPWSSKRSPVSQPIVRAALVRPRLLHEADVDLGVEGRRSPTRTSASSAAAGAGRDRHRRIITTARSRGPPPAPHRDQHRCEHRLVVVVRDAGERRPAEQVTDHGGEASAATAAAAGTASSPAPISDARAADQPKPMNVTVSVSASAPASRRARARRGRPAARTCSSSGQRARE